MGTCNDCTAPQLAIATVVSHLSSSHGFEAIEAVEKGYTGCCKH
jgi:hypothetical protein